MDVLVRLRRQVRLVCVALGTVGAVSLMGMMFLVTADVARRDALNQGILGTFELVEYLMVPVVFFGFALGQLNRSHISVDVVVGRMPARLRGAFHAAALTLTLGFIAAIGWVNLDQTLEILSSKETSQVLLIPRWPFQAMTVVGSAAFCLALFVDIMLSVATAMGKHFESPADSVSKVIAD